MSEKFDIYDIFGILVPGILIVCAVPLIFPAAPAAFTPYKFPDAFVVIGLTAVSIFVGHLVQSLASFCEPWLNKTWGGRASERALEQGLGERYMPADMAQRIKAKLVAAVGPGASTRSLFLYAMQKAEVGKSRRVPVFNALYAYNRGLVFLALILLALFIISFKGGLASTLTCKQNVGVIVGMLALLLLLWNRARQRGFYFAKEVLISAEHAIDFPGSTPGKDEKE